MQENDEEVEFTGDAVESKRFFVRIDSNHFPDLLWRIKTCRFVEPNFERNCTTVLQKHTKILWELFGEKFGETYLKRGENGNIVVFIANSDRHETH